MDTQPAFGFKELLSHVVGDMAKAVSERHGEARPKQAIRAQAAAFTIMGFLPRDVIEAMLAGHCVMLHELMVESTRDSLTGDSAVDRRTTRSAVVAMDRAFGSNLARLERYQMRPSAGSRDGGSRDGGSRDAESSIAAKPPAPVVAPAVEAVAAADVETFAAAASTGVVAAGATSGVCAIRPPVCTDATSPSGMVAVDADPDAPGRAEGAAGELVPPDANRAGGSAAGLTSDGGLAAGVAPETNREGGLASNGRLAAGLASGEETTSSAGCATAPGVATRDLTQPGEPASAVVAVSPVAAARVNAAAYKPTAAAIAACRANPEAMAALDAGDPLRFARAMGIDVPAEAYLAAAAAAGSPFDRSR